MSGVVEGGGIDRQTFYLGKNDFFSTSSHAIQPLGRVVLAVPGLAGSSYHVVQDIAHAQVKGSYTKNGSTLATTSWVSATENLFVTSLVLTGGSSQAVTVTPQNGTGGTPTVSSANGVLDADVTANPSPQARVAAKVVGGSSSFSGNTISFTLQPNVTYTLTAAVVSSIDQAAYQGAADTMVSTADLGALGAAHASWWQSYWAQSFVEIPDKTVEKSWYGSLYLLGSVSRSGKYAPGLWGNWITGNMNWNGDYHTNYNYETPFYAGPSTNHVAQTDPYDKPVLDWLTAGQNLARQNGFQGVLYPVGLSPLGTSADLNLHNQKSNTAFVASNMVMLYEFTHDPTYATRSTRSSSRSGSSGRTT